jgi:regulator of RNase E activity RraA
MVDRIDKMEEPVVWVCEAVGSRPEHECVFGDGMAKALHVAGCSSLVTNGGVRDIPGLMSIPFAAYARGLTIHHCALTVSGVNEPVQVGGIQVTPGDVIHANNEGVIKLPASCLRILPEKAGQMLVFEKEAHEIMRRPDLPPLEKPKQTAQLLKKFGF